MPQKHPPAKTAVSWPEVELREASADGAGIGIFGAAWAVQERRVAAAINAEAAYRKRMYMSEVSILLVTVVKHSSFRPPTVRRSLEPTPDSGADKQSTGHGDVQDD